MLLPTLPWTCPEHQPSTPFSAADDNDNDDDDDDGDSDDNDDKDDNDDIVEKLG